jgi:excisionase family DNA binding protein
MFVPEVAAGGSNGTLTLKQARAQEARLQAQVPADRPRALAQLLPDLSLELIEKGRDRRDSRSRPSADLDCLVSAARAGCSCQVPETALSAATTTPSAPADNICIMDNAVDTNDTQVLRRLLTPAEAAAELRVSRETIYRWARTGMVPTVRVGGSLRIPSKLLVSQLARSARARVAAPKA